METHFSWRLTFVRGHRHWVNGLDCQCQPKTKSRSGRLRVLPEGFVRFPTLLRFNTNVPPSTTAKANRGSNGMILILASNGLFPIASFQKKIGTPRPCASGSPLPTPNI